MKDFHAKHIRDTNTCSGIVPQLAWQRILRANTFPKAHNLIKKASMIKRMAGDQSESIIVQVIMDTHACKSLESVVKRLGSVD